MRRASWSRAGLVVASMVLAASGLDLRVADAEATLKAPTASRSVDPTTVSWPAGLVAFFPMNAFGGPSGTSLVSTQGGQFAADLFPGGTARLDTINPGPFGASVRFDGSTLFSVGGSEPSAAAIGALDVTNSTGEYTVIAWAKDEGGPVDMSFRAGSHVESGPRSSRQYGLYFNGHAYGGQKRVTPHISTQDGPTPGYPWNADFAASARQLSGSTWHMEAGTYDGQKIVAYVDGVSDSYPDYTDAVPNSGFAKQRFSISKNPYFNDLGINGSATKKVFTIGGALKGETPYIKVNTTRGWIGGVAVFNRALAAAEIKAIHLATLVPSEPVLNLDLYSFGTGPISPQSLGWRSFGTRMVEDLSASPQEEGYRVFAPSSETGHLRREGGRFPALAYFELPGFSQTEVARVSFDLNSALGGAVQRVAAKFGNQWYVSEQTFAPVRNHPSASDWNDSERVQFDLSRSAGRWRPLAFEPNSVRFNTSEVNLVRNPSIESGLAGWNAYAVNGGAVGVTRLDGGTRGERFARYTWSAKPTTPSGGFSVDVDDPVVPGVAYSGSIDVRHSIQQRLLMTVIWRRSDGSGISQSNGVVIQNQANTWATLQFTGVAPAGATKASIRVIPSGSGTAWPVGSTIDADGAYLSQSSLGYFDGDSNRASWNGVPHASASSIERVRSGGYLNVPSTPSEVTPIGALNAIGFYSDSGAGATRIRNVSLWR